MTLTPAGLDLLSAKAEYASAHGISAVDVSPNELAALIALARRALELESALAFLEDQAGASIVYGEDCNEVGLHSKDIVRGARELGWPGLQSEGGKEQDV